MGLVQPRGGALSEIVIYVFAVDVLSVADEGGAVLAAGVALFEAEEFQSWKWKSERRELRSEFGEGGLDG